MQARRRFGRSRHRTRSSATAVTLGIGLFLLAACGGAPRAGGSMAGGETSGGMDDATGGMTGSDAEDAAYSLRFTSDGRLRLPEGEAWREWPYIGTPLTPNALNGGEAPFPEFHSVYIDPASWQYWRETGEFQDGTILAKELVTVYAGNTHPDGSTDQVSGRGYFMGELAGFEIAYKSAEHFPDEPGNWAYFSFGHHAPPYAGAAEKMPVDACAACHQASAAQDFVFTQFYPVLRAARGVD